MKKLALLLAALGLAVPGWTQTLTKGDRERGMSELHATRKQFLDAVTGLSEAQWNFKPAPEVWSVAECAEHIALSEDMLFNVVTGQIMKTPADPSKRAEVKGKEEQVLTATVDRSQKFKAPEPLRPTHRWSTRQELIDHFKESRDRSIGYVENTQDDLRDHFMEHPAFKLMDGYQWLMFISAHSHRHTLQIEEVKSNPNFPKP
jgi:uncharacterized damage-inducible protein DinB